MTETIKQIVFGTILTLASVSLLASCEAKPDSVLQDFYDWDGTEQTYADPLIVAGDEIVPILLIKIKNPEMPKRMEAIYFLTDFGYRDSISVISVIVEDESDHIEHRSGALYAITHLDSTVGLALAKKFSNREDLLGETARELLSEGVLQKRKRSYRAAYFSYYSNGIIQIEEP